MLLATVLASSWMSEPAWAAECTPDTIRDGTCVNAGLGPDSATLDGSTTTPGTTPDSDPTYTGGDDTPDDPLADCRYILNDRCLADAPPRPDGSTAPVTLADIASFHPTAPTAFMEPDGWAIIGLSTNFYAPAAPQVVDGLLLGQAASVRFTAVAWRWDYGDGQAATLGTGGASWRAAGIRELDPTATSHVFHTRGDYTVTVQVDYRAEYRFAGGPWVPIAGILTLNGNPLQVHAMSAKTVLVDQDCTDNPTGPGC